MNQDVNSGDLLANLRQELELPAYARLKPEGSLGSGGMGAVDTVFDQSLERYVARKTLHAEHLDKESIVKEFVREVKITAALDHPFILPVYEVGLNEARQLYFTMKRFSGGTLLDFLQTLRPGKLRRRSLFQLLEVFVKACDAIGFAHHNGVVHCDIKPEHIVMSDFGQVYVIDWGIAHLTSGAPPELKGIGGLEPDTNDEYDIKGTPLYMAPEQAAGNRHEISPATDVFSIGAILYHVLAWCPLYPPDDPDRAIELAKQADFPPMAKVIEPGTVAPELVQIVSRAVAASPADRYPDALALGADLRRFMGGGGEFPSATYSKGTTIVRQGEPGDCAYIIKSGRCEAFRKSDCGDVVSLGVMEPGAIFGELALLTSENRSADVVAIDDPVVLHKISATEFGSELKTLRPWIRSIIEGLAKRLREAEEG